MTEPVVHRTVAPDEPDPAEVAGRLIEDAEVRRQAARAHEREDPAGAVEGVGDVEVVDGVAHGGVGDAAGRGSTAC